jgi:hypothetical protein
LHLFIFPDSRAQFITLLDRAGLLPELNKKLGWAASEVDFWSYVNGLEAVREDARDSEGGQEQKDPNSEVPEQSAT